MLVPGKSDSLRGSVNNPNTGHLISKRDRDSPVWNKIHQKAELQ